MELSNSKIILRNLKETDLNFIYEMSKHNLVFQFEEDSEPTREGTISKYLGKIKKMEYEIGELSTFLILRSDDGVPIGEIHTHLDNKKTRCWEIGYSLHPDYWGNGYASDAAKLVIRHIFEKCNGHKIIGCCNGKNIKSGNCMERAGMKREGWLIEARLLRGEWCDELVYSILDKDFINDTDM